MTTATRKPGITIPDAAPEPDTVDIVVRRPPAYVKGSWAAGVRAVHDTTRSQLLARQEVAQAERQRLDDELADIDTALKLCSEPALESNVTVLRQGAAE